MNESANIFINKLFQLYVGKLQFPDAHGIKLFCFPPTKSPKPKNIQFTIKNKTKQNKEKQKILPTHKLELENV